MHFAAVDVGAERGEAGDKHQEEEAEGEEGNKRVWKKGPQSQHSLRPRTFSVSRQ